MIDAGREAVAAAEDAAFGGTDLDEPEQRERLHQRIVAVAAGPWWAAAGPPVRLGSPRRTTRSSSARTSDRGEPIEIRLADEQLTTATAAHELAHALAGVGHGHDAVFRAAYVDVVALLAGSAAAGALADAFAAFGLTVARRRWPAPFRADGDTFRLIP